jgi:hypothetical protein
MIVVRVEIKEKAISRRVRGTALSFERALELAGEGKPGRKVSLVFPIQPEAFFVGGVTPEGTVAASPEFMEVA